MKHAGCILEFTDYRNKELIKALKTQLAQRDYIIAPQIFESIANSPAPRFWVSEERATVVINALLSGKSLPCSMRPTKREMFNEIFRRVKIEMKKHPTLSVNSAVAIVVNQPAPKFYLTPRTVGELIYRIKNGWYK